MKVLWIIVVSQLVVCLVFAFGDIGFDHPGRFGLDFGHALLLLAIQGALLLISLFTIICLKRWSYIVIPLTMVVLTIASIFYGDR